MSRSWPATLPNRLRVRPTTWQPHRVALDREAYATGVTIGALRRLGMPVSFTRLR